MSQRPENLQESFRLKRLLKSLSEPNQMMLTILKANLQAPKTAYSFQQETIKFVICTQNKPTSKPTNLDDHVHMRPGATNGDVLEIL